MTTFWASLFVFGLLIFFHELGHFSVAKLVGMKVYDFAIGMGPKIIGFRRGETYYSIRLLPIGGFVNVAGENGKNDEELENDIRAYYNKPVLHRMSFVVAGPIMNLVLAILLFSATFAFIGVPFVDTSISEVIPNTPASEAGLKAGDKIISINNNKVSNWIEMVDNIQDKPNQQLTLQIKRGNEIKVFQLTTMADNETGRGQIGIAPTEPKWVKKNIFESLKLGTKRTIEVTVLTFSAIVQLITGKMSAAQGGVAGPVGIVKLIGESASYGLVYLMNLAALISINLGLFNLLPIPALDGSRLVFLTLEGLRGKPISPSKENFVHLLGFALLMLLMVVVTYKDIVQLIK